MSPLLSDKATELRLEHIRPYLRGNIIDIGCGWARVPKLLSAGQNYTGIDSNEKALEYNRRTYPQYHFLRRDLNHEPLNLGDEAQFDTAVMTAVMTAVIEHLKNPEFILNEIRPYLTPGGWLLITTPTPLGDWLHRLGDPLGLFYSEKVVAHVEIFSRKTLHRIAAKCGYDAVQYRTFAWGANQLLVCRPF